MLHAMFRIFRKAPGDMPSTGRFSKYARYAVEAIRGNTILLGGLDELLMLLGNPRSGVARELLR